MYCPTSPTRRSSFLVLRQGLGITTLPCFVGDADPLLVRVPGTDLHLHGTLWLLTQGETRKTKRVRLFTEFISRRLAAYAPLLAGLSVSSHLRAAGSRRPLPCNAIRPEPTLHGQARGSEEQQYGKG